MLKVGQMVRVKRSLQTGKRYDGCSFASEMEQYKGREFLIRAIPFPNRYKLDGAGIWSYTEEMLTTIESEEDAMINNIKVGDTIKVTKVDGLDKSRGITVGDTFKVAAVDDDDFIRVNLSAERDYPLFSTQFVVVSGEMTFAEMAAKLVAGEFAVGTELAYGHGRTACYVNKAGAGYGLSPYPNPFNVELALNAYCFNATWTVKAPEPTVEPAKEMSIEDLQKELGYKVKIVE